VLIQSAVDEGKGLTLREHETDSRPGMLRFGRTPALLLSAIAVLVLALPLAADAAQSDKQGGAKVTVMTRNIFLGADLGPALNASTFAGAIDGAGVILNEVDETNFPERAKPLAKEIAESEPDLVGLQEVALWRQQIPADGPPAFGGTAATEVRYNFLALLLQELEAIDAEYQVVRVQQEFDQELPADLDGSDATGNPFLAGAELDARLTMRDVILAKKGSAVRPTGETDGAHFENLFPVVIGGVLPIRVERGWVSTEAKIGGTSTGFRFVNTHLEAFGADEIREAQAKELFAPGGPLDTDEQVILVGDLNSGTEARHNIHGTDQLAFLALQDFGMTDNGAIQSCCYSDLFDPTQVFDHTVDHVLTKPGLETRMAFVTGNDPAERTPSGLWPSDHGGVVSTLELRK
jgi:endonuclease/exonuclease/phosphatase family metal-dependent hydrolase